MLMPENVNVRNKKNMWPDKQHFLAKVDTNCNSYHYGVVYKTLGQRFLTTENTSF